MPHLDLVPPASFTHCRHGDPTSPEHEWKDVTTEEDGERRQTREVCGLCGAEIVRSAMTTIRGTIDRAFASELIGEPPYGCALLLLVEPDGFVAAVPLSQKFLDDSEFALITAADEIANVRKKERG